MTHTHAIPSTMKGAYLPGDSTVIMKDVPVPEPGHGEVLIRTKSSTICGSDIRAIYHEHLGKGAEGYNNKVAGHEPSGQIIKCGPGLRRFREGDRVIVYHISGCGVCNDCRRGFMISCTSPHRAAYGWQRDGGMASYILAEEKDLVLLPDSLSYTDGAQMLVGVDTVRERCDLAREKNLADHIILSGSGTLDDILALTEGGQGFERSIDCSGNTHGRQLAIRATRKWGKMAMVGEGGTVEFNPSPDIIHDQITIYGSWVTSIWLMEELVERIARWEIHPEVLVTHRFTIDRAAEAYKLMAGGKCGKVAIVFDEEIPGSRQ